MQFLVFTVTAIGNAFGVLNDPKKRKQYDLYGPEEEQDRGRNHSAYNYSHGFEGLSLSVEPAFVVIISFVFWFFVTYIYLIT